MEDFHIALLGGDARTAYMLPYFLEKGYRVICYGTKQLPEENENMITYAKTLNEAVGRSRVIVGGIPFIKADKLFFLQDKPDTEVEELCRILRKEQKVFGGVIPKDFMETCIEREIACYDFMKDEPLAVFNAVATAEGAILEALKNKNTNIHGSKTLVLGYGRCGRVLAGKLKGLGAKVTVCSRCEVELAIAETVAFQTLPLNDLKENIQKYEYIFNTIPAVLLHRDMLKRMRRDVLLIDIASGEGGIDYVSAEKLGIQCKHTLGLPGKYAPKISAKGLVDFVIRKME